MNETRITKERIRNHFTYGWWKYLLLGILAIFGWNMLYTMTAYRAPKDKRLDIYFVTYAIPNETQEWFQAQIIELFPQLEDSSCVSIAYSEGDDYYGNIQLTTYVGAGDGDIYIMTRDRFNSFKESGVFVPLDDAISTGALNLRGIDVTSGIATDEDGVTAVYGIPAESLYGMMYKDIDNRNLMICVMGYSANQDLAIEFIDWLIETMEAPKPDWLVEEESKTDNVTQSVSDIPSY